MVIIFMNKGLPFMRTANSHRLFQLICNRNVKLYVYAWSESRKYLYLN